MKKITKIFVAIIAVGILASAQMSVKGQAFEKGSMVANAGLGFGWYSYGYGNVTSLPAISVSLEKGIKDFDFGTLAVGGIVGFKHASLGSAYGSDWSWTDYIIAARGAIHADLFKVEKLDTYAGVALGLRLETWKYETAFTGKATESSTNGLFALYAGARYYFTEKFAAFGEVGYGLGYLTLGVSLKLK